MKKQFNGEITKPHRAAMAACACPFCKAPVGEPCPERRAAHPSRYQLRERMIRAHYDAEARRWREEHERKWPDGGPESWRAQEWHRHVQNGQTSWVYSGLFPKRHHNVCGEVSDTGRSFRWSVYGVNILDAGYCRSLGVARTMVEAGVDHWNEVFGEPP